MHRSGIKESSYAIRAYPLFQTLFYLNFKPFLLDSFLLSVWHEASRELTVGLIKKTKAAETNLTFTDGFNERTRPHISSYQLQLNTTVDYNICQCKWKIKTTPPFWMMKKWRVLVLALVHGWYWERGGFNSYFSSIKIVASHPGWGGGGGGGGGGILALFLIILVVSCLGSVVIRLSFLYMTHSFNVPPRCSHRRLSAKGFSPQAMQKII